MIMPISIMPISGKPEIGGGRSVFAAILRGPPWQVLRRAPQDEVGVLCSLLKRMARSTAALKYKGEKHGQGTAISQTRPHQGLHARAGRLHQRRYLRRPVGTQGPLEARPPPHHS